MRFLAPDAGGGSGGGENPSGAAANGGGANDKEGTDLDPKLFDSLPWDELDDNTRATLEKIKTGAVATLQSKQHLNQEFQRVDKLARGFQSEADRLKAEAEKAAKGMQQQNQDDPINQVIHTELIGAGYTDAEAIKLAPVFGNMFKKVGVIQTGEFGKALAPMAATVLAGQAQDAFLSAQQQDPIGMFQIPEVQQGVWDLVRQRVDKGMETDPAVVLNLAKMVYVDHQTAKAGGGGGGGGGGGNNPPGILPTTPPTMRTGGLFTTGPGGTMIPIASQPTDPNAPRTVLNDDTRNALATSFRSMTAGLDLKKLPDIIKPPGGRR